MEQMEMNLDSDLQKFRLPVNCELFAEERDGVKSIGGYAVKWGDEADRWDEKVQFARGAFRSALKNTEYPIVMLQEHEGAPIASTLNESLSLREDKTGLKFSTDLNMDLTEARDAYVRVKDQISTGISVGVMLNRNHADIVAADDDDEVPTVIYKKVEALYEISLVAHPAFKSGEAAAKFALSFAREQKVATGTEVDNRSSAALRRAKLGLYQRVRHWH